MVDNKNMTGLSLDEVNLVCDRHQSPIGGICNDINCGENSLMCILCAVDESSCIKKYNHELVTFEEFFAKFDRTLISEQAGKKQTMFEFLKLVKELKLSEIEKNFRIKFEEKVNVKNSLLIDFKKSLVETGICSIFDKKEMELRGLLLQLEKLNSSLQNLKGLGFEILNQNKLTRFNQICEKYDILKEIKSDLDYNETEHFNKIQNTTVMDDLDYLNSYVNFTKTLRDVPKMEDFLTKARAAITEIDMLSTRSGSITGDSEDFERLLSSVEFLVPKLFSVFTKYNDSDIKDGANFKILTTFTSTVKAEVFSYRDLTMFNTSQKMPFCSADPTLLHNSLTVVSDFQKSYSLMDMVVIFKTCDQLVYLAYSTEDYKINIIDITNGISSKMQASSLKKVNSGVVLKIEHYISKEGLDYMISLSSDKSIHIYKYNKAEKKFAAEANFIQLKKQAYSFEVAEIDKKPHIIVNEYNSDLKAYNLYTHEVITWKVDIPLYTYAIKAFYNIFTNKTLLILSAHKAIYIFDLEAGKVILTFNSNTITWNMGTIILKNSENKDYHLVANCQNSCAIFSLNEEIQIASIKGNDINDEVNAMRGLESWSERCFAIGCDSGKIKFFDTEQGKLINTLSGHSGVVAGVKRFQDSKKGDVLISFGADQTIRLWTT